MMVNYHVAESHVMEIELTPQLKKKQEDIDWWYQIGINLVKDKYTRKHIGVRDKKILVFDTLEQAKKEVKKEGLSFLTEQEDEELIFRSGSELE